METRDSTQIRSIEERFTQLKHLLAVLLEKTAGRRQADLKDEMDLALQEFNTMLALVNEGEKIDLGEEGQELRYAPLNTTQRIQFIHMRPYSYHAIIQLDELTKELEKIYVKKRISSRA